MKNKIEDLKVKILNNTIELDKIEASSIASLGLEKERVNEDLKSQMVFMEEFVSLLEKDEQGTIEKHGDALNIVIQFNDILSKQLNLLK